MCKKDKMLKKKMIVNFKNVRKELAKIIMVIEYLKESWEFPEQKPISIILGATGWVFHKDPPVRVSLREDDSQDNLVEVNHTQVSDEAMVLLQDN